MKKLEGNFKRRPRTLKVIKLRWMIFLLAPIRNRTLGHNKIEDAWGPKENVVVERVDPDRYVHCISSGTKRWISCKCTNHCLENFKPKDVSEHIYNFKEF